MSLVSYITITKLHCYCKIYEINLLKLFRIIHNHNNIIANNYKNTLVYQVQMIPSSSGIVNNVSKCVLRFSKLAEKLYSL